MKQNIVTTGLLTLALGAGMGLAAQAQAQAPAPQIYLNNQILRSEVSPIQQNGRVLVPMRSIFEDLGATVNYNDLNRSITATKGDTVIRMALGSSNATVNGLAYKLDVPAKAYYGRTLVPLRFVSEAMGAKVNYNANTRVVMISGRDYMGGGNSQVAGTRQISIPADSVIPVTLDQSISSENAYVGQTFSATVESSRPGDSEFPQGTKILGPRFAGAEEARAANPAFWNCSSPAHACPTTATSVLTVR